MKPLFDLAEKHPLATGITGAANSALAYLMGFLNLASDLAGKLVVLVFFANAILTFLILLRKYRRNAVQRCQAAAQDVDELEEDRIP